MFTAAGVRPRVDLVGLLANVTNAGHVALRVLPMLMSAEISGQYFVKDVGAMQRIIRTKRTPNAATERIHTKITNGSFVCEERSVDEPVSIVTANMLGSFVDAEGEAGKSTMQVVANDLEADVAAAVQSTTTFTAGLGTYSVAANPWADPATAQPLTDVQTAKIALKTKGIRANAMVLSDTAARYAWNSNQIQSRLTNQYGNGDGMIPMDPVESDLARIFGLDEVIIARCMKNTANAGATSVFANTWSDSYVTVFAKSTDRALGEPQLGRIVVWTNAFTGLPRSGLAPMPVPGEVPANIAAFAATYDYEDPTSKSVVVGTAIHTDEILTNTLAGYLILIA